MPINQLTPYRFTKTQRRVLEQYLTGAVGINEAADKLKMSRTRIYTIVALIMRHASSTGAIDAKTLLTKY